MVVSLLFWLSLLAATAMFAAVGLSPKILERMRLEAQFDASQFRLVQMEQQNEQLERVLEAIRKDKDFAAEMTRIEFDAMRQDEEIIPVESGLRLSPRDLSTPKTPAVMAQAWYRPVLVPFAENDLLRRNLLTASAVLVVIAFTWLQPARATQEKSQVASRESLWRQLRNRYVRAN
jgi:cell division protein FtsB